MIVLLLCLSCTHGWVVEEPPGGVNVAAVIGRSLPVEEDEMPSRITREVNAPPVTYRQKQRDEGRYISYQGVFTVFTI